MDIISAQASLFAFPAYLQSHNYMRPTINNFDVTTG